jgi:hypothetical protein
MYEMAYIRVPLFNVSGYDTNTGRFFAGQNLSWLFVIFLPQKLDHGIVVEVQCDVVLHIKQEFWCEPQV